MRKTALLQLVDAKTSSHHPESPPPPGLIEKVNDHVSQKASAVARRRALILIGRRLERPIYEQGTADHIVAGNKAPISAVVADIAIVTHHEIAVWGHNNVVPLHVLMHGNL